MNIKEPNKIKQNANTVGLSANHATVLHSNNFTSIFSACIKNVQISTCTTIQTTRSVSCKISINYLDTTVNMIDLVHKFLQKRYN